HRTTIEIAFAGMVDARHVSTIYFKYGGITLAILQLGNQGGTILCAVHIGLCQHTNTIVHHIVTTHASISTIVAAHYAGGVIAECSTHVSISRSMYNAQHGSTAQVFVKYQHTITHRGNCGDAATITIVVYKQRIVKAIAV